MTSEDLTALEISADLAVHYVRAGWLQRLARGVYCRPNDPPALHPSLVLLQRSFEGLHVGGKSGKGVGLVVPSLLTWPGSAIVHDIKGENWTLTAGFRARHGRVLLFDPTNSASAAYNPLLEVRKGEWEVRDVQNVADIQIPMRTRLNRSHRDVKIRPP